MVLIEVLVAVDLSDPSGGGVIAPVAVEELIVWKEVVSPEWPCVSKTVDILEFLNSREVVVKMEEP